MGISRGFANPFPQISFAKPKSAFKRINTLVERSSDIKVNAKVERKIIHSFQNRFVQRIGFHHTNTNKHPKMGVYLYWLYQRWRESKSGALF